MADTRDAEVGPLAADHEAPITRVHRHVLEHVS